MLEHMETNLSRFVRIRQELQNSYPDADEETILDTLEGLSDLPDILAEITRSYLDDKALSEALKDRIRDMTLRLDRYKSRYEKKKKIVAKYMKEAELSRLSQADLTVSLRQGAPSVEVIDEALIPGSYWQPVAPKLDRKGLLEDLKKDKSIEGVSLKQGNHFITVRTK